jgi:hypothetical protein
MSETIQVDLPHQLGAEEARRRIAGSIGRLKDQIPGGGDVKSSWTGDRLDLSVGAMGQQIAASIDIRETLVHVEVTLPAMLGFFGKQIEGLLRRQGAQMLEDKSKG